MSEPSIHLAAWDGIEPIPIANRVLGIVAPPAEPRPLSWLRHYGRKTPGVWEELEALRHHEQRDQPAAWYYVSVAGARALMARKVIVRQRRSDGAVAVTGAGAPERLRRDSYDGAVTAALGAWRMGKGIYRFDPDVYDALWATALAVDDPVPSTALLALPEWCVYIQAPRRPADRSPGGTGSPAGAWPSPPLDPTALRVHGMFAHLTPLPAAAHAARAESPAAVLRLLIDLGLGDGTPSARSYLLPYALPLGPSLGESLKTVRDPVDVHTLEGDARGLSAVWARELRRDGGASAETIAEMADLLGPFVSLVLYLCTANAEIHAASDRADAGAARASKPTNPTPTKVKGGMRLFPATAVRAWDVAFRLGAALRRARHEAEAGGAGTPEEAARARPRPHLRRAHFHTYWRGPRQDPTARTAEVRWLPPILVNAGDEGPNALPATIRAVP